MNTHTHARERDNKRAPELAQDPCDQPQLCAEYDSRGYCMECGFPANCHDY